MVDLSGWAVLLGATVPEGGDGALGLALLPESVKVGPQGADFLVEYRIFPDGSELLPREWLHSVFIRIFGIETERVSDLNLCCRVVAVGYLGTRPTSVQQSIGGRDQK